MDLTKFFDKHIFEILSIILMICVADQIYMMMEYKNISKETLLLTLLFTGISIFFGFLRNFKNLRH